MATTRESDRTPLPVIHLDNAVANAVSARVNLIFGDRPVELAITLPANPVPATDLLPIYRGLTNLVVDIGVEAVERRGEMVSCRKGCGAYCRQPVPISESEARAIAQLVADLPEPRRSMVEQRFADARTRLAAAGLLEDFAFPERVTGTAAMANSARYFDLGIACPFLEDESCSIHLDRPLACREYLVTSPAENCSRPSEGNLRPVPLPARVAAAVRAVDRDPSADGTGWVLLALALDWAVTNSEPPPRPGPAQFQEVFDHLLPRFDWINAENLRPFLTASAGPSAPISDRGTGPRWKTASGIPTRRPTGGMNLFTPLREGPSSCWR